MFVSCDTMVALSGSTKNGQTLFAKNSDRPKEECQTLVQRKRAKHSRNTTVKCQFVELPQVEVTHGHVGSRPHWCWGYEHGFNDYQVAIGNEALPSKLPPSPYPKLVGMEIVRLGLERGSTAEEAVEVMTSLITKYGQGPFENKAGVRTYDNSYIVADPEEAYVIETVGHEWVIKRVDSALGISNVHSIGTDWDKRSPQVEQLAFKRGWWETTNKRFDFAEAYQDLGRSLEGRSPQRRSRSCAVLSSMKGDIDIRTMLALLRDHHYEDVNDAGRFEERITGPRSICMHYGYGVTTNTTASLVADLCSDGSRLPIYWTSLYAPCLGIFMPVFSHGTVPSILSVGNENPSDDSPWWIFRNLDKVARQEVGFDPAIVSDVRSEWSSFQEELLDSAYLISSEAKGLIDSGQHNIAANILTKYMCSNMARALRIAKSLVSRCR